MYSEFPFFFNRPCIGNLALKPPRDAGMFRELVLKREVFLWPERILPLENAPKISTRGEIYKQSGKAKHTVKLQ